MNRALSLADAVRKRLGMDRAIAYVFAARVCMALGSIGTVLLIVHFLSKVDQGYYYTLISLVNLQIIFELGFSFVILQLAAHEAVHLQFRSDGHIDGDPHRRARLVAILQKTAHWYFLAGAIMAVTLLPAGITFFRRTTQPHNEVWLGPWTIAALATVLLFVLNPLCSFIEGCGQVRQVAGLRFAQAGLAVVASWGAIVLGKGLYAPGLMVIGNVVAVLVFLAGRRKIFLHLLREKYDPKSLDWRTEVWSFQWRIAITWVCSYFTVQVLTPVLFASRGPVEAGRMGMSLSITAYTWNLVYAWMSTKATPFGQLIAKKDYVALDHLFFHTLWVSLGILGVIVTSCMAGLVAIQRLFPNLASRMVSPQLFVLLLITAVSTLIVQSEAIYLRAHKEEPLLWQAVIVALLTSAGAYIAAPRWGISGTCVVYFLCTGIIGVTSATLIFRAQRRSRGQRTPAPVQVAVEIAS
jgi:O-antigen/teichoic acid export membrane protein